MDRILNDILIALSQRGELAALVPILTGGAALTRLTPWIPSEEDFDRNLSLAREVLIQQTARAWKGAYEALRQYNALREDADGSVKDALSDLGRSVVKTVGMWSELRKAKREFRLWYGLTLATTIMAVLAGLVGLVFAETRLIVGASAFAFVIVQIIAVVLSRRAVRKAKEYAQTL